MLSKHHLLALVLVTLFMTALARPCVVSAADETSKVAAVRATDLVQTVKVIGRLGRPLGTMLTVQGTWHYPDDRVKDYSLRFTITHIDSRPLKSPIELNVAQVRAFTRDRNNAIPGYEHHRALAGVSWTLRAFETGRFNLEPAEFWKATGMGATAYYADTFESELVGIVQ